MRRQVGVLGDTYSARACGEPGGGLWVFGGAGAWDADLPNAGLDIWVAMF